MIARIAIIGLAAARLTRAVQHEQIGQPVRDYVDDRLSPDVYPPGTLLSGPVQRRADRRAWLLDLATCDHCLGFWIAFGLTVGWRIRPVRLIVEALAASAILSAAVDHYTGWEHE